MGLQYYQDNNTPVIGIYTMPCEIFAGYQPQDCQIIFSQYVKYFTAYGARSIAIPYDATEDQLQDMFSMINGLVFTGGWLDIHIENQLKHLQTESDNQNTFTKNAKYLIDLAIQANNNGISFPIYGECQGMELMLYIANDYDYSILESVENQEGSIRQLYFINQEDPKFFLNDVPDQIKNSISTKNSVVYAQNLAIYLDNFPNTKAADFYQSLAYSVNDTDESQPTALKILAAIQAKDYPFFGVQFHPTSQLFLWNRDLANKDYESTYFSRYIAKFFIAQTQLNDNKIPLENIQKLLIQFKNPIRIYLNSNDNKIFLNEGMYLFKPDELYPKVIEQQLQSTYTQSIQYNQKLDYKNLVENFQQVTNNIWLLILINVLIFLIIFKYYSQSKQIQHQLIEQEKHKFQK